MKLNGFTKRNGELAARRLSATAWELYCDTDPLEIHEYDDANGDAYLYALRGTLNEDGLTFEDLNRILESYAAEIYGEDEEA